MRSKEPVLVWTPPYFGVSMLLGIMHRPPLQAVKGGKE